MSTPGLVRGYLLLHGEGRSLKMLQPIVGRSACSVFVLCKDIAGVSETMRVQSVKMVSAPSS